MILGSNLARKLGRQPRACLHPPRKCLDEGFPAPLAGRLSGRERGIGERGAVRQPVPHQHGEGFAAKLALPFDAIELPPDAVEAAGDHRFDPFVMIAGQKRCERCLDDFGARQPPLLRALGDEPHQLGIETKGLLDGSSPHRSIPSSGSSEAARAPRANRRSAAARNRAASACSS